MLFVEIRVEGHLDEQWSEWLEGLTIVYGEGSVAILTGLLADQAALYGVISKLRDLGIRLLSVESQASAPDGGA